MAEAIRMFEAKDHVTDISSGMDDFETTAQHTLYTEQLRHLIEQLVSKGVIGNREFGFDGIDVDSLLTRIHDAAALGHLGPEPRQYSDLWLIAFGMVIIGLGMWGTFSSGHGDSLFLASLFGGPFLYQFAF